MARSTLVLTWGKAAKSLQRRCLRMYGSRVAMTNPSLISARSLRNQSRLPLKVPLSRAPDNNIVCERTGIAYHAPFYRDNVAS